MFCGSVYIYNGEIWIMDIMKSIDKSCKTCRYHRHEDISDGYVCVNDESEACADWTEDDFSCDKWEMYRRNE